MFNKNSKILITGANGFLGKNLVKKLKEKGYENLVTFTSKDYDLTKQEDVKKLFNSNKEIDIILHLAAHLGGVGYLKDNPGEVFYKNLIMNTMLLEEARLHKTKKLIGVSSVFAYPPNAPMPLEEKNIWEGNVEEVTSCYSWPKRMALKQAELYKKQFGMNIINLLITSMYGPGMSSTHAIPSMIKRFEEAIKKGETEVTNWGTGKATRDLLYVEDATEAILKAVEVYNSPEPINIASGKETSIKELAETIASLTGFKGDLLWDETKPEGPKKVLLDVTKAEKEIGFKAKTSLEEGLKKTIDWFRED